MTRRSVSEVEGVAPLRMPWRRSWTCCRCPSTIDSYFWRNRRRSRLRPSVTRCSSSAVRARPGSACRVKRSSSAETKKRELPGIALAARAAAQLMVDAPALVAVRSDHVQPAAVGHAVAQPDVDAAARHVRGDRHRAPLARARDDRGFRLFVAGVQHRVGDVGRARGSAAPTPRRSRCPPAPVGRSRARSGSRRATAASFSARVSKTASG